MYKYIYIVICPLVGPYPKVCIQLLPSRHVAALLQAQDPLTQGVADVPNREPFAVARAPCWDQGSIQS